MKNGGECDDDDDVDNRIYGFSVRCILSGILAFFQGKE